MHKEGEGQGVVSVPLPHPPKNPGLPRLCWLEPKICVLGGVTMGPEDWSGTNENRQGPDLNVWAARKEKNTTGDKISVSEKTRSPGIGRTNKTGAGGNVGEM